MWRTASSMELIPAGNRTQLGDALSNNRKRITCSGASRGWARASCFTDRRTRCLRHPSHRAGSKRSSRAPKADDALVSLARRTGDPVRDVSPATFAAVRAASPIRTLIAQLEGEAERDERALGRIFGEACPRAWCSDPEAKRICLYNS